MDNCLSYSYETIRNPKNDKPPVARDLVSVARDGMVSPPRVEMTDWEGMWIRSLTKPPQCRSLQDLQVIYYGLSGLEALQTLRDSSLRALCKVVRYEKHLANDVLY